MRQELMELLVLIKSKQKFHKTVMNALNPEGSFAEHHEEHKRELKLLHNVEEMLTNQQSRIGKLEGLLQKVLTDSEIGVVPRSHLNNIETALKS